MPVAQVAAPPLPGVRTHGTVSRWTERGYGFITPNDGGDDLFCHSSNIEDGNGLEPGAVVEFVKIYDDTKGKERAEQVTGGITVERFGGGGSGGGGGFGRSSGVCFDWQAGKCMRGAACRFSHGPDGMMAGGFGGGFGGRGHRVCFDWQKGQCTRGDACRFSHSAGPGGMMMGSGMGFGGGFGGQPGFGGPGGFGAHQGAYAGQVGQPAYGGQGGYPMGGNSLPNPGGYGSAPPGAGYAPPGGGYAGFMGGGAPGGGAW